MRLIDLKNKLNLNDKVFFVGVKKGSELVTCLNEHRYILVPSVWEEPFGLVALEGMACGCLPIVSNCGGLPNAIGNAGLTFRKGDVDNLVDVLTELLSNSLLEKKLRDYFPSHLALHTSTIVAKKYLNVIQSAINER